ncbi:uncharacterized protein [Cicer arietinum]|uniref:Uncharacterized protein LOC101506723 n=1 Tax=Cicer arietinum TaxID=3827 RepID=A0A1S2XWC8_CICAR|nr:uncharacterized protein LOC101506723 [Cicer arietinum]
MIPRCFTKPKPKSNISSSNNNWSQVPQHVVTCIYQTQLCKSNTYITLTWSRTLSSHSLTIHAPNIFPNSITISLNPSTLFFFKTKRNLHRSKSIYNQCSHKIKFHWNFSNAKFVENSAEPSSYYYLAISYNRTLLFYIGDILLNLKRNNQEIKCGNSIKVSRREHVFGNSSYVSRVVLFGSKHEIEIECVEGVLRMKVDGESDYVVKRMAWGFRGYEKIVLIEGIQVEFYWDVLFNWAYKNNNTKNNNNGHNNSVFVFQVGDQIQGIVWPEMLGVEKRLMRKSVSDSNLTLEWVEKNNSSMGSCCESGSNAISGFSLLPYAWTRY